MVKWKIIIAVSLYIILGVIAYFNFGFHHLMVGKVLGKRTSNISAWKNLEGNIKNTQKQGSEETQDPILEQVLNPSEQEMNLQNQ